MPVLRTTQGHEEFEEARREGVRFLTRLGPKRFHGTTRLEAIELRKVPPCSTSHGRFNAAVRRRGSSSRSTPTPAFLPSASSTDLSFLTPDDGVELTPGRHRQGRPETLATSAPGIYAGGDVAFGPRNLIEAVANGKRAARSIHEYLSPAIGAARVGDGHRAPADLSYTDDRRLRGSRSRVAAHARPRPSHRHRRGRDRLRAREARRQAARCLVCHVQTIYDPEKCVLCNRGASTSVPSTASPSCRSTQLDLDPELTRGTLTRGPEAGGLPLAAMVKDDDRCIRCGLCAIRCPTDAMTMERFRSRSGREPDAARSEGRHE
jgi:formate dehydrogenase beta subunit